MPTPQNYVHSKCNRDWWHPFHTKSLWKSVCAHNVTIIIVGNGLGDTSSNSVYISQSADTVGKGVHPTTLFPVMSK